MPKQHKWVKITQTPVKALPDLEDDNAFIMVEDGEEQVVYGCDECGVPLQGNDSTECQGAA